MLTEARYASSLVSTVVLATATTVVTLLISGIAGVFLTRNRFTGRELLTALLTLPLAFPGVVIGFMVIMLAGRQGLIPDITDALFGERVVFAYSMAGLFVGYLYFSGRPDGGRDLVATPYYYPLATRSVFVSLDVRF